MIRSFFSNKNDKQYFRNRFLDIRSLIDVFQQKNDIIRKILNLQEKSNDFRFLSTEEKDHFWNLIIGNQVGKFFLQ